jgi:hypothetical protein
MNFDIDLMLNLCFGVCKRRCSATLITVESLKGFSDC